MEKKLKRLFDFQRIAQNPRLSKLIAETEERCSFGVELSDDELDFVAAAGEPVYDPTAGMPGQKPGGR